MLLNVSLNWIKISFSIDIHCLYLTLLTSSLYVLEPGPPGRIQVHHCLPMFSDENVFVNSIFLLNMVIGGDFLEGNSRINFAFSSDMPNEISYSRFNPDDIGFTLMYGPCFSNGIQFLYWNT